MQLLFGAVSIQPTAEPAASSQDDSQTGKQHEIHYRLLQGKEFTLNEILMSYNSPDKI